MTTDEKKKSLQVIKASAGSGKTYQLTFEFIKLLLGEKDLETGEFHLKDRTEYHQHILAVTFTNKATDEMKGRIVDELNSLRLGKSEIASKLVGELHTTDDKLVAAAQKALEEILFNYTTFNVTTIDSFFQMVLRTFAYELDQDYDYAVELDSGYTASVAVHNMLMDIGGKMGNKIVTAWLGEYMRHQLESGNSWNVFSGASLGDVAKLLESEIYRDKKPEMDAYLGDVLASVAMQTNQISLSSTKIGRFSRYIGDALKAFVDDEATYEESFKEILSSVNLDINDLSVQSGLSSLKNAIYKDEVNDKLQEFAEKEDVDVVKAVRKWSTGKSWRKDYDANMYDAENAFNAMQSLAKKILTTAYDKALLQSMKKNIYQLGLLGVAGNELDKFLKDNDIMLLSDTNQLLKDVIVKGNILFVYERLGTWVNHCLIDEFQDTSTMQYQNMKPLIEESVSIGNENLVIGDEKQCIYRFRNSAPELLQTEIVNDFREVVNVDRTKVVNWRSAPNIIRFNNTIFSKFVELMKIDSTYGNLLQCVNDKEHGNNGLVKITFVDNDESGKGDSAGKRIAAKERVLAQLPELINDLRRRGYAMKDIAILVNRNDEGSEVIDALLRYNLSENDESRHIDVVSGESMLLRKSPSVRLVISNLRYFDTLNLTVGGGDTPGSMRAKQEIIRRVLRQVDIDVTNAGILQSDENQDEIGDKIGDILKENLQKKDAKRRDSQFVEDGELEFNREYVDIRKQMISDNADSFDLLSIVDNIIRKLVDAKIRESEKAFLMAFMDCVIDYSSKYAATVHSFLKWWDGKPGLSINSPMGRDAVNVLTIHKSKGLEYPCVIIPFADWMMLNADDMLWIDRKDILLSKYFKDTPEDVVPPLMPVPTTRVRDVAKIGDDTNEGKFEKRMKSRYDKMCKESYIDNLNRTYVAFTRAVNELHIFTTCAKEPENGSGGEIKKLGEMLKRSCVSINEEYVKALNREYLVKKEYTDNKCGGEDVAVKIEYDEASKTYFVGDAEQKYEPKKKDEHAVDQKDKSIAETSQAVDDGFELPLELPQYSSNSREVTVCLPEIFNPAQERGIRMHKLLSMLKHAKDRERTLRIAERRGVTLRCEKEAEALVDKVLSDPNTSIWFDDNNCVINERTIFDDGKKLRPDRIVRTPEGNVIVIDYKFGTDHSKDSEYRKQVSRYMKKLREAGMNVTEGYVWYPDEDLVLPVEMN